MHDGMEPPRLAGVGLVLAGVSAAMRAPPPIMFEVVAAHEAQ